MLLDILPFFKRTIRAGEFERSAFALVRKNVTDKKALGEALEGVRNLERFSPDSPERQRLAAELYLLLERNLSEEQSRNRIPAAVLRERILNACHPERAEGNFALMFLPHYERQIRLYIRFTENALARARELMGEKEFASFMGSLAADPEFRDVTHGAVDSTTDGNVLLWSRVRARFNDLAPAVERDKVRDLLRRLFSLLSSRMVHLAGEMRAEMMFKEIYQRFHDPIAFIEDSPKVLLLLPDEFLEEERIGLMGKAELEEQLRRKSKVLETTLAEVRGEKLKLSEMTREELERKVEQRTAELVSALTAAETARKNLEEFSSLATHELRTPVAAVKGYLNLIETDKKASPTPEQKKYIREAIHANDRLLTLVNAMLDVSRIELGTLAIDPVPMSLTAIADGALGELAPKVQEQHQTITKDYGADVPATMPLDKSLTHAIFMNILSNAIKYTPENGTITLAIKKRSSDILITVADTGFGIPLAQQPRIFEKLFRADNARAKIAEGTGLGLYLVKSIIDQVGGTIRFESTENKGTTFFITLPLEGMKKREGSKGLS